MDFSACPQILFGPEQEGPPQMSPTGPSGPDAASFSGSLERDWWALRPGSWGGGSMYLIKTFLTVAPSQCANEVACRTGTATVFVCLTDFLASQFRRTSVSDLHFPLVIRAHECGCLLSTFHRPCVTAEIRNCLLMGLLLLSLAGEKVFNCADCSGFAPVSALEHKALSERANHLSPRLPSEYRLG